MAAARTRLTIAWWMRLVAAVAVVCAIPRLPAQHLLAPLYLAGPLLALEALGLLFEAACGTHCPLCSRWALWRLALPRGWYRYYRCAACGGRLKRRPLGLWLDASGPEDAVQYRRRREPIRLEAPAPAPDDPSTSATLLRNKWLRTRQQAGNAGVGGVLNNPSPKGDGWT